MLQSRAGSTTCRLCQKTEPSITALSFLGDVIKKTADNKVQVSFEGDFSSQGPQDPFVQIPLWRICLYQRRMEGMGNGYDDWHNASCCAKSLRFLIKVLNLKTYQIISFEKVVSCIKFLLAHQQVEERGPWLSLTQTPHAKHKHTCMCVCICGYIYKTYIYIYICKQI